MLDEFTESIGRYRAAREGRPVRLTKKQQQLMAEFNTDADQAVREMERRVPQLDDAALLTVALSGVQQQIELDEKLFSGWHDDDKPAARALIEYQQDTLRLIEQFIDQSTFRGMVKPLSSKRRTS
jgi:hypothetical protein